MSGYTEHYNLKKPAQSENYNVEDANTNNTIIDAILFGKVDKVAGKDLSSNDFTNEYKLKLDAMGKIYNYLGTVQNLDALGKIENSKKGDLYHVQSESADYAWNGTKWEKVDSNKGDTGVGITEIKCQESTDDSGINVITIKLSDGRETSFNVRNGTKGKTGEKGETGDTGPRGETGSYPVLISTATGNPIHIEDSSDLEMKLKLKGGHKQETTEGYNIFDYITNLVAEGSGLKNTLNEDGSITTVGKLTENYGKIVSGLNITDELNDGETYTIKTKELSNKAYLQVRGKKSDGSFTYYNTTKSNKVSFTVNKSTYVEYYIGLQTGTMTDWGDTSRTINNTYMMYKGNDDKDFEPYTGGQASPSIDYQSDVEVVGNNINILPDKEHWEQGTVDNNTGETLSSATRLRNKGYIGVEPKTNYFVSVQNDDYCLVNIILYDKKGVFIKDYYSINNAIKGANALLIAIPENCYNMKAILRNADDTSNITVDEFSQIKAKFEKGDIQTPYSAYNQGSVEVIKRNRNQFDIAEQTRFNNGITANYKKGKFSLKGTATANWTFLTLTKTPFKLKAQEFSMGVYNFNPAANYSIEFTLHHKDNTTTKLYLDSKNTSRTYNISKDVVTITIGISGFKTGDVLDLDFSIKLVSGKKLGEWVEPKSKKYVIPIQQKLLEGDYIDDAEHHEWHKLILTGTEPWYCETNGRFGYLVQNLPKAYKKTIQASDLLGNVCNSYIEKTPSQTWTGVQGFCIDAAGSLRIWDDSYSKTSDLAGFKAMLAEKYNAGNPVVCYLKLATPIALELTKKQKEILNSMKTYKNETNIIVDNELATMEVEYQTDAEVNELLNEQKEKMWGVGSIYTTTLEEDPAIILGLGKWIRKKILNGGELIAYGTAYNQDSNETAVTVSEQLAFSDTRIPNKKFNIKNLVDGVLESKGGTFNIIPKGIVGLVKCTASFSGLGGSGIKGLWWQGNSNALPDGVKFLSNNHLLTGPTEGNYGGNSNVFIYEVTDDASDDTEFFINPFCNPYGGNFGPCQAGTKCELQVEVYSKKQTTYVWERIS